jgi:hypothetical protein
MDPDPEGGQLITDPEPDIFKAIEIFLSNWQIGSVKSLEFIKYWAFFPNSWFKSLIKY